MLYIRQCKNNYLLASLRLRSGQRPSTTLRVTLSEKLKTTPIKRRLFMGIELKLRFIVIDNPTNISFQSSLIKIDEQAYTHICYPKVSKQLFKMDRR